MASLVKRVSDVYPCANCQRYKDQHLNKKPFKCLFGATCWKAARVDRMPGELHREALMRILQAKEAYWNECLAKYDKIGNKPDYRIKERRAINKFEALTYAVRRACRHTDEHGDLALVLSTKPYCTYCDWTPK